MSDQSRVWSAASQQGRDAGIWRTSSSSAEEFPPPYHYQINLGLTFEQSLVNLNTCDLDVLQDAILKRQIEQQQQRLSFQNVNLLQRNSPGPSIGRMVLSKGNEPFVTIIEQPKSRSLRFRYKCEGRSAGSISGESTTNEKKTFPSIKINNFDGPAAIVVVSCVTKDKPHMPHPHNLVGQDCKDGVCTVKVKGFSTVSFPNIGIQCCKRQDVEESLRARERIRVDPFATGYPTNTTIQNIDVNSVRLCFQVFLPDANKKFTRIVPPVVSQPIVDKKSIHDLVICRLSKHSGYAAGGEEVFLLCEKINKDDIQVRFYQETDEGISWEAFGEFAPHDIHRQYAIVFKTSPYHDQTIRNPVSVFIQLRRPSDDEVGDPKPFQYLPQDPDPYGITQKRKRKDPTPIGASLNRIPMTVVQEGAKDDLEHRDNGNSGAVLDLKTRLKKKAEKSLMNKDKAAAASSNSNTEQSSYPTFSIVDSDNGGTSYITISSEMMQNLINIQHRSSTLGQDAQFSEGDNAESAQSVGMNALMQYINENGLTMSSLMELNSSCEPEQVSNDFGVVAQEMVVETTESADVPDQSLLLECSSIDQDPQVKSETALTDLDESKRPSVEKKRLSFYNLKK